MNIGYMFLFLLILLSCTKNGAVYTLYRNSVLNENLRIHVATFDAEESGEDYNNINCNDAAKLKMSQIGVKTRFWCEKGRFSK